MATDENVVTLQSDQTSDKKDKETSEISSDATVPDTSNLRNLERIPDAVDETKNAEKACEVMLKKVAAYLHGELSGRLKV